jgi:NADP-dependent 3-hydroxy acid dehydrogenase YdfG
MSYILTKRFPGKRAFVTGAASGLGKAICMELAGDGWTIGAADINTTNLVIVGKELEQAGARVLQYQLDVADKTQYAQVAAEFLATAGGIDLLFNNAGVAIGGEFEARSLEDWEWIVGINLMGVIYGCHLFIPAMKQQGGGHIINTASAAAFSAAPTMAAYNATKAAVLAISETLYAELHPHNIQVSAIMPTFFRTNIAASARGDEHAEVAGKLMIETSGIEASWIAQRVLKAAGRKRLHIVLPFQSAFLFFFKRMMPMAFVKMLIMFGNDKDRMRTYLQKKHEKMVKKGLAKEII